MAQLRPADPPGLPLSRARALRALFGDDTASARVGRFRVLEHLGSGAMGVVYEAYDPDLDRGVALKLVDVPADHRDVALAEAKALARLSHPNVVPIFDVGIEGDRVYLVMELVRGKTLRHWIDGRRPREVLATYHQAGAALAAAHAAGLVHRDFKPDNAIVGSDGRVRVVDFGLACKADDPSDKLRRPAAGTPRFMAPEIVAGAAVTAAADQYSFCVALGEALASLDESTPGWILAAVDRGRAADPAARFASMAHVLRALARDPARTRRRVALVAGIAIACSALAFYAGALRAHAPDLFAGCDRGAGELATAWDPMVRAAAMARIGTLDVYGQKLRPMLERRLEAHANSWVAEYQRACVDRIRHAESDALSDRRSLCLRRTGDAFARLAEHVAAARPADLADLDRAAQSLPDPAQCSDLVALGSDADPPPGWLAAPLAQLETRLSRARVDLDVGHYAESRDAARTIVVEARALDYGPALARALLLEGHAQMQLRSSNQDRAAAAPLLAEASSVALAAGADAIAVEAWARLAWVRSTETEPAHALDGLEQIAAVARRPRATGFARALLYNNLGSAELARGERDAARTAFERALRESQGVTGAGRLELVAIRANLGLVTNDHAAGDRLIADAEAERTRLLGSEHPDTLAIGFLRGTVTIDDLGRALTLLTLVCRDYALHAMLAEMTAQCWSEVGWLRWELGDHDAAIEALALVRRASPTAAPEAAAYQVLWRGDAADAVRQFGDLVAGKPRASPELAWQNRERSRLLAGLGRAQRRANHLAAARGTLETAVAELAAIAVDHPSAFNHRRLGRARIELALTLVSLGAREQQITPVVAAARKWLQQVNSPSHELDVPRLEHRPVSSPK